MTGPAILAEADLTIRTGTAEGRLSGSGSRLTFSAANLSPFIGSAPRIDRGLVRDATTRLAASGISLSVVEDGDTILDIGDVEPSLIARAFGFSNVRIQRPIRLLARSLRR
jgi:hypothetical protein